jgi:hypothetical protein
MSRKRAPKAEPQIGLFDPPPVTCTALAVFAPPPEAIGRLLGWVYPGDTRIMYGKPVTFTHAYNKRWAWWRQYRE